MTSMNKRKPKTNKIRLDAAIDKDLYEAWLQTKVTIPYTTDAAKLTATLVQVVEQDKQSGGA